MISRRRVPLRLAYVEDPGELAAAKVEKAAHALLAASRTHGEWFSVTVDEAWQVVRGAGVRLRKAADTDKPSN